jgi:hypothetical protein
VIIGNSVFSFNGASPVNDTGFENHVFGQQRFAGLGRAQQNNVLDVLFIIDFHTVMV